MNVMNIFIVGRAKFHRESNIKNTEYKCLQVVKWQLKKWLLKRNVRNNNLIKESNQTIK